MKRYILLFALVSCISFSASAQRRGHGSYGGYRGGGGYAGHGGYAYHGGGGYRVGPVFHGGYYERPYYRGGGYYCGYRGGFFRPYVAFRAPFIYTPSIFSVGLGLYPYSYYRPNEVVVYNNTTTVAPNNNQNYNNNSDFQNLLNNLYNKQYDSDKLSMAKISTMSGNFSSQQVEDIMRSFTNESSRLEYAEFAYTYVIDRANFGIVTNAFQYPSSAQDLQNYIQRSTGH